MSGPAVSVVVVARNEAEHLRRTVLSFLRTVPEDSELLVVDNGSTDGCADGLEALLRPGVDRLLRVSEPLGVSGARNYGAREAKGELLVFSDAHVEVPEGWLGPIQEALSRPGVGAVGPAVASMEEPEKKGYGFVWRDAGFGVDWLPKRAEEPYPVPFLVGCFVAMRRERFEAVGGFDAGLILWGMEDAELSLRLWRLGEENLVVPEVEVRHLFRSRHPYRVEWEPVLHNQLRTAVVHLDRARIAEVVRALRENGAFPAALARLVESDAWARREAVAAAARRDCAAFFERFGLRW